MSIKRGVSVLVSVLLCCLLVVSSAWAGNVQRNRWEGVAIGLGAAIIGSALFSNHHHYPPARRYYSPPEVYHHYPPASGYYAPSNDCGYWEIRKVWVPPTYKRIWNPAHYNRRGEWVSGQWIEVEERPGYWEEKRVWVSRR